MLNFHTTTRKSLSSVQVYKRNRTADAQRNFNWLICFINTEKTFSGLDTDGKKYKWSRIHFFFLYQLLKLKVSSFYRSKYAPNTQLEKVILVWYKLSCVLTILCNKFCTKSQIKFKKFFGYTLLIPVSFFIACFRYFTWRT